MCGQVFVPFDEVQTVCTANVKAPKQGSKLSIKLQEPDGLILMGNLGVCSEICESPKYYSLLKNNKKNFQLF